MGDGRDTGTKAVTDSILKKTHVPDFDRLNAPTVLKTDGKAAEVAKTGDGTGTAKAPPEGESKTAETTSAETKAAETKAAETKAAEAKAAEAKRLEAAKTPEVAKETGTTTTTDKSVVGDKAKAPSPELLKGLAAAKEVARILDNDVPTANGAKDLKSAEAAYNKAIEIAKSVPKETIEQAKVEYEAVLKAKQAETDPDKKRVLADRQAELYTLTRVKDCALGNMALWYYRQGRTEEGTTKFLEAAGLSPEDAKSMKGLPKDQFEVLAKKLDPNSPILTDVNFMAQYTRIKEGGQQLPEEFVAIHKHLLEQKKEKLAQTSPEAAQNTTANTDSPAVKRLETLAAAYDGPGNAAALKAFQETDARLTASTDTKISEADRKVLAAGVKAVDDNFEMATAVLAANREQLNKLVPADKQEAFAAATDKVAVELEKMKAASGVKDANGNPQIAPADLGLMQTVINQNLSQADRDAAKAKINAAHPEFGKAMDEALGLVNNDPSALNLSFANSRLALQYQQAAIDKGKAHYMEAALVARSGDTASAKTILESGFTGLPANIASEMKTLEPVAKLATAVGANLDQATAVENPGQTGQTDAGNNPNVEQQTTTAEADLTPEEKVRLKPAFDALAKLPAADQERIKAMEPQQLKDTATELAKASDLNKLNETRAVYEVLLAKLEDPGRVTGLKAEMTARVEALEKGTTPDGKPLDAATRIQYHKDNVSLMASLAVIADVRQDYAAYLGGKNSGRLDTKNFDQINPIRGQSLPGEAEQMDLNKSMDEQLELMYKAADSMPIDLIKREQANLLKSTETIGSADKDGVITGSLDFIQGTKQVPGLLDMSVTTRTRSALMYISQGAVFDKAAGQWKMRDIDKVDELYQPTKALALVNAAAAKYKEVHGANATDPELEKVKAIGMQLAPEKFKALYAEQKRQSWSSFSDIAAGGLALASEVGVYALAAKFKLGAGAGHALGTGTAFVTATSGRALLMRYGTGEWENPGESAAHGLGVTALVSGTKYAHMGLSRAFSTKGVQAFEEMSVATRRFGNQYEGTMGQFQQKLVKEGFKKEADAIGKSGFADKKIAELTDDQLKTIFPKGESTNGIAVISKLEANSTKEFQAIVGLEKQQIHTVGDLKNAVEKGLQRNKDFVAAAKAAGVPDKATYREAMEFMSKAGDQRYSSAAKITDELKALENGFRQSALPKVANVPVVGKVVPTSKVGTVGELEAYIGKATPESEMERLFPALKGKPEAMTLREVEVTTKEMFGNLKSAWKPSKNSEGWKKVGEIDPAAAQLRDGLTKGQFVKKHLIDDRFYSGRLTVPKGDPVLANAQKVAGNFERREDLMYFGSYVVGATGYRSITGVYDKMGKGVDTQGNPKKYTLGEALTEANFGSTNPSVTDILFNETVKEGLLAGFILKGAFKPGTAEANASGIRQALGLAKVGAGTFGKGALMMAPNVTTLYDGVTAQQTLRPKFENADKPLTDYNYDLLETPEPAAETPVVVPEPKKEGGETTVVTPEVKQPTPKVVEGESAKVPNPNEDP